MLTASGKVSPKLLTLGNNPRVHQSSGVLGRKDALTQCLGILIAHGGTVQSTALVKAFIECEDDGTQLVIASLEVLQSRVGLPVVAEEIFHGVV